MNAPNPLLLDIAERIETERLVLRAPRHGDGSLINEAILESLDELKPWLPWAQSAPSITDSETYARQSCVKWQQRTAFFFRSFRQEQFISEISLHRIDWNVPRFEIGYWSRTSATGQGLTTEAVAALREFAFETLKAKRIEIRCSTHNTRSRYVAERAGFPLESIIKNDERDHNGALRDTCVFALTREDSP